MSKPVAIRYLGIHPVFNMTVMAHHNYVTSGGTVLHNCDGLRYFCISRSLPGEPEKEPEIVDEYDAPENDYDTTMTGGEANAGYINY